PALVKGVKRIVIWWSWRQAKRNRGIHSLASVEELAYFREGLQQAASEIAGRLWESWGGFPDEGQLRADVKGIAETTYEEMEKTISQIIDTLASEQPEEVRGALTDYLRRVSMHIRDTWRPRWGATFRHSLRTMADLSMVLPVS